MAQRSSAYFHLYQHSYRNHAFSLLAAHGALWGSGHFAKGLKVGRVLSNSMIASAENKDEKLAVLEAFATAFKEIKRQVCVEIYTSYHMTRLHGEHLDITKFVSAELIYSLNACHRATREELVLSDANKRGLFQAFFLWEQENIVDPGIDAAISKIDWPVIMWLAMKPAVGFKYFDTTKWLWFLDFSSCGLLNWLKLVVGTIWCNRYENTKSYLNSS